MSFIIEIERFLEHFWQLKIETEKMRSIKQLRRRCFNRIRFFSVQRSIYTLKMLFFSAY